MILIALKVHSYEGRQRRAGDRYTASDKFGTALILAGLAMPAAPVERPPVKYETKEQHVESPVEPESTPAARKAAPRKKRVYKRRDVTPKE